MSDIKACKGLLKYALVRDFYAKGYTWLESGSDWDRFNGADWLLMGKVVEDGGKLAVRHAYIGDAGVLQHIEFPAKRYENGTVGYSPMGKEIAN